MYCFNGLLITEVWMRLDQCVIDNEVKQWRQHLRACVPAYGRHSLIAAYAYVWKDMERHCIIARILSFPLR